MLFFLGRAGEKGDAYTLVTEKDKEFAGHLVRNLEAANQQVSKELLDLALTSSWFRKSRFKAGKAKALGGRGLGFRERPGLGASATEDGDQQNEISTSNTSSTVSASNSHTVGPASQAYCGGDPATTGPATNRLAAMKAAFQSQYRSQVCSLISSLLVLVLLNTQLQLPLLLFSPFVVFILLLMTTFFLKKN